MFHLRLVTFFLFFLANSCTEILKSFQKLVVLIFEPGRSSLFTNLYKFSEIDNKILIEVRGKKHEARVSKLPFYKKSYVK